MDTIANRIKQGLEIRNMKQADIVEKTNINKGALSSYISGKYEPKQNNIYKIAEALNVNEAWLMGHDVPMSRLQDVNIPIKSNQHNDSSLERLYAKLPDTAPAVIHRAIKHYRIEQGIAEKKLSEDAGISLHDYLEFEAGTKTFDLIQVRKLIHALGVDESYICGFMQGILVSDTHFAGASTSALESLIDSFQDSEDVKFIQKKLLSILELPEEENKKLLSQIMEACNTQK